MGNNNRLYTLYGVSMTRALWCSYIGINYDTVVHRMKKGLSLEEALTTPVSNRTHCKPIIFEGKTMSMTKVSHKLKIGLGNLRLLTAAHGNNLDKIAEIWKSTKSYKRNSELASKIIY